MDAASSPPPDSPPRAAATPHPQDVPSPMLLVEPNAKRVRQDQENVEEPPFIDGGMQVEEEEQVKNHSHHRISQRL